MSLILGMATPEEAAGLVLRHSADPSGATHRARYTTVGALRDAGFRVEHRGRFPGSPFHVSVFPEDEWGDEEAEAFDSCFKGGDSE